MILFIPFRVKVVILKNKTLVLASTSKYRIELLQKLGVAFSVASPGVDETPLPGEAAELTAARLARAKAESVASDYPGALIIGSDQVAVLGALWLGKPLSHDNAVAQLRAMRGKEVLYLTALCLLNSETGRAQERVIPYRVKFRMLEEQQIERYLRHEEPYQCAGSAKAEGLGIALIEWMRGDDPNALVGLPLAALVDMLHNEGISVL
jgi:septum formation protein